MALSTLLIRTASKAKSVAGHDDRIDTRSAKGDEFSADQRDLFLSFIRPP